jgi:hypothetical protein
MPIAAERPAGIRPFRICLLRFPLLSIQRPAPFGDLNRLLEIKHDDFVPLLSGIASSPLLIYTVLESDNIAVMLWSL